MKPLNRKEIFLEALAKGEQAKTIPLTREEKLLAEQSKRESSAGIKTAIIKSSNYDDFIAGIAPVGVESITFECINMTYGEAMQTMMAGEPLQAVIMFKPSGELFALNAVGIVAMSVDNIQISCDIGIQIYLRWTSDGLAVVEE